MYIHMIVIMIITIHIYTCIYIYIYIYIYRLPSASLLRPRYGIVAVAVESPEDIISILLVCD